MKIIPIVFILTGLFAGPGIGNVVEYMPGMKDRLPNHLISFWQHADYYFRTRIPVFGNALLVSLLFALFLIRKEWQSNGSVKR